MSLVQFWRKFIGNEHADSLIADLISLNQYRYRPGMEVADWDRIQAQGAHRWAETVKARKALRRSCAGR